MLGADWLRNEEGVELLLGWLDAAVEGRAVRAGPAVTGGLGRKVGTTMLGGGGVGVWLAAGVLGAAGGVGPRRAGFVWFMCTVRRVSATSYCTCHGLSTWQTMYGPTHLGASLLVPPEAMFVSI